MTRKLTPLELAALIDEDQYGMPQPSVGQEAGPDFDQGGGGSQGAGGTTMANCAAVGCVHNQAGQCALESIDVNDTGGCAQYEACADGACGHDGGGRYEEGPEDGAPATGIMPVDQLGQARQTGLNAQSGRWDPKGGGF